MAQNKQELQKELQQLKRKWKAKEENLKEEHEGEMKKVTSLKICLHVQILPSWFCY